MLRLAMALPIRLAPGEVETPKATAEAEPTALDDAPLDTVAVAGALVEIDTELERVAVPD